jgi:Flp pilus assembly protein TadG
MDHHTARQKGNEEALLGGKRAEDPPTRLRTPSVLRGEQGASAVEFALIAPVLFMVVFAIIGFGIGFMQVQSARGAVREGARSAAVVDADGVSRSAPEVQVITADASAGLISADQVTVTTCSGPGAQAIVSFDTSDANSGTGINVQIPFLPSISMDSTVTAQFMCEGSV